MYSNEIQSKLQRVAAYLQAHGHDGVLLSSRANFAWVTGGRDNHIVSAENTGVAAILATSDQLLCLTNHIESPRFRKEELVGTGIEVVDFPWWDAASAQGKVREIIADRKIVADAPAFGLDLPRLSPSFNQLRWQLGETEIQRYRFCGALACSALESVCRQVQIGETEFEIAARMEFEVQRTGAKPYVALVASDDRVFNYRHPIPTGKRLERYAMLVLCAEYRGLIASCTRFIHFGAVPEEIRGKQQAVVNVDTAVNLATRVGRPVREIFADLQGAYEQNGWAAEWQLHHQGGSTGYAGREVIATPFSPEVVQENQAFAWNPSIAGTKSEDTMLVGPNGIEWLTRPGENWPKLTGHCPAGELVRPDILVR